MDIIRDKVAFEEGDVKDRRRVRKVRSFVSRSDNKVGEFLVESLEFTRVKVLIGAPYQVVSIAVQDGGSRGSNLLQYIIAEMTAMLFAIVLRMEVPTHPEGLPPIMVYHMES